MTSDQLKHIMTPEEPLGPRESEVIVNHLPLFLELYQTKANLNQTLRPGLPAYVVGRKGAGKTAFLIGEGLHSGSNVVAVQAAHAFSVVNVLRLEWERVRGTLPADNLAFLWEALLIHAAMRGLVIQSEPHDTAFIPSIQSYLYALEQVPVAAELVPTSAELLSSEIAEEDSFLAAVGASMLQAMHSLPALTPMREVMRSMSPPGGDFTTARQSLLDALNQEKRPRLCVVIDNLEDLQRSVTGFEDVLAGLFRITSKVADPHTSMTLPFDLRFAFPAELINSLSVITATPEKDFKNRIVIEWTARELHELASRRIETALRVHFDGDVIDAFRSTTHDSTLLRALLPATSLTNGLGQEEDPIAYVMRHTQLLPRHLIHILNEILSPMIKSGVLRRATRDEVLKGTSAAEDLIVQGILSSYLHTFPELRKCLRLMRNRIAFTMSQDVFEEQYDQSGAKKATGLRYNEFLSAVVGAGIIGLEAKTTRRYVEADFSYTFPESLYPLPEDRLCLHPLFVHRMHDHRSLDRIRKSGELPILPYGSSEQDDSGD